MRQLSTRLLGLCALGLLGLWLGPRPVVELWSREAPLGRVPREDSVPVQAPGADLVHRARALGLDPGTLPQVQGPVALFDPDGDGDWDLYQAPSDLPGAGRTARLFLNDRGRWRDVGSRQGPAFSETGPARRCWALDDDGDGRTDLVLELIDGSTIVLRNHLALIPPTAGTPAGETLPRAGRRPDDP